MILYTLNRLNYNVILVIGKSNSHTSYNLNSHYNKIQQFHNAIYIKVYTFDTQFNSNNN